MMMMADEFQYLLVPIAFTTEATQDGPLSTGVFLFMYSAGWSELSASGVTHATAGRFPFLMSLKMTFGLVVTFVFHSGPFRTALIASNALQMPEAPLSEPTV